MEQDEKINSFPYEATIGGICHYYRITENEAVFGIEQDGVVIATVQNTAGRWQQLSGKPMGKALLDSIGQHIEAHPNLNKSMGMKVNAKEVIGFVSAQMGISFEDAQEALCITDREIVIELQPKSEQGRYQHIVAHDLDTGKVELDKIAGTLGVPERDLETYVEDDMIWIVYGGNIVEGIAGSGPDARFATADFYRQWFKDKVAGK